MMEINGFDNERIFAARKDAPLKRGHSAGRTDGTGAGETLVSGLMKEALSASAADGRSARVEALRAAVADGTYSPDPAAVARKVLGME